jgi:hypothetical protein
MRIPKYPVPVRVALANGDRLTGLVYVRQGQRITDMLCDERPFMPFKARDAMSLINKAHVARIEIMGEAELDTAAEMFPEIDKRYLRANNW